MLIVSEATCREVLSSAAAFSAVENAFAAMARGEACNFPVVREAIGHADALYGFKGGFNRGNLVLGVKAGGYWPHNDERGLTNHQSTVFLFDPDTGQLQALVGGNYLTALRTAAASAVSIKHLARPDARVLGMIGAGFQSTFQLAAACEQRRFEKVLAWNFHPEMLPRLSEAAAEIGVPFEPVSLDRLGAEADVIVTITSSFAPVLMHAQVKPGTHIACMGTDTRGKQELDPALVASAAIFTDEAAQAASIGECQHAIAEGRLRAEAIVQIGAVIAGLHPGRADAEQITLFDGTGVALQDLAVASAAARLAAERGMAVSLELDAPR